MALVCTLAGHDLSLSLIAHINDIGYASIESGMSVGDLPEDRTPRKLTLPVSIRGSSIDDVLQKLSSLESLLYEAYVTRARNLGRVVTLTMQPNGATTETIWDILGGSIVNRPSPNASKLLNSWYYGPFDIEFDTEPYARSAEVTVLSSGNLYARVSGITDSYVWDASGGGGGGAFGVNIAGVSEGSFFQTTKFTTTPTAITPANGDIRYFGNQLETFDRLILGIKTAAVGVYDGVWEFYDGATWTAFTPDSNPFKTTLDWDTTGNLDQIVWTPDDLVGWARTTINNILAYWVRWRISAFTSMATVPVTMNGPISSHVGVGFIDKDYIKGDSAARASIKLVNSLNPNLSDDFTDNTQGTEWNKTAMFHTYDSATTVVESGGVLTITPPTSTAGIRYNGYNTVDHYDMTNASVQVKCAQAATKTNTALFIGIDENNSYSIFHTQSNELCYRKNIASTISDTVGAYSAVNDLYWRIRHDQETDTIYWETSADAVTWTTKRSFARELNITVVHLEISAGTDGSELTPGSAIFDDFVYSGNAKIAGLQAALATGHLSDVKPPLSMHWPCASEYISGSSDVTASVVADARACLGEAVAVGACAAVSNRAQIFDGINDETEHTVGIGNKLDLGTAQQWNIMFMLDEIKVGPVALFTRNDAGGSKRCWYIGYDNGGRLRAWVSKDGVAKTVINGGTILTTGVYHHVRLEFKPTGSTLSGRGLYVGARKNVYLFLDGVLQGTAYTGTTTIKSGIACNIRTGQSYNWVATDGYDRVSSEGFPKGRLGWYEIRNDPTGLEYDMPTSAPTAGSATKLLCLCQDNAASTTIVDSSSTPNNGSLLNAGNTNANGTVGPFQAGVGTIKTGQHRIMGGLIPQAIGQEYQGTYEVFLEVRPLAAPSSIDDYEFMLQIGVGDNALGMTTLTGRKIPEEATPDGYFLIDMGPITFPDAKLEDYIDTPSARNFLTAYLYIKYKVTTATTINVCCLRFMPTDTWRTEYCIFNPGLAGGVAYPDDFTIDYGKGVIFDSTSPDLVIEQVDSDGNLTPNFYQSITPDSPRIHQRHHSWLVVIPLRGKDDTDDYLYRGVDDCMVPTVIVQPQWNALASP